MQRIDIKQQKEYNLNDLQSLAVMLAQQLEVGDVLALKGDLGVGKTSFARFLIAAIQDEKEDVPSPTFTLMQSFATKKGRLCHFDLYRLKAAEEIYEIGLEDALNDAISVIEWPEIIENILPKYTITIEFSFAGEGLRYIEISGGKQINII